MGRQTSVSSGPFECEACNLFDLGCEFVGVPHLAGTPGGRRLPPYLRVDLGARKHWHISVGGRDTSIALFGTITNVLGRSNVLTEILDPISGERDQIDMRPRSPLVLGLDWRF